MSTWFGEVSWGLYDVTLDYGILEQVKVDEEIVDVAVTHLHMAILMKNGRLAVRRIDQRGGAPMVLDTVDLTSSILVATSKSVYLCLEGEILKVLEDANGSLNQMTKIRFPWPVKIVEAVGGHDFVVFRDSAGNLFSMGTGTRGELGVGLIRHIDEPVHIEQLAGIPISKLSCGGWHTVALTESGDAYTWGWNRYGQLGKQKAATEMYPVLVDPEEEFGVKEEDMDDVETTENTTTVIIGGEKFKMGSDDLEINEFELK